MAIDPYSSPNSHVPPMNYPEERMITEGVIQQLKGTKPWVRFMSVLLFIGAGTMLLGALIVLVAAGALAAASNKTEMGNTPVLTAGIISAFAILYALFALIYVYPALKLWKYADRIASLMVSGNALDLEEALNHQRAFWKFLGITVITIFVLYIVAVIGMLIFGVFAAVTAKGLPSQGSAGIPQHLTLPSRI
jgi:uncharacterized membrane protein YjgN (DUF898 family)